MPSNLLSLLLLIPIPALLVLLLPGITRNFLRSLVLLVTGIQLILAIILYVGYEFPDSAGFSAVELYSWVFSRMGTLGWLKIDYFLGVDGISLPLVMLSAIVLFIAALASSKITSGEKGYYALFLLLCITVTGCFLALDFFLFYLFFEFMLLPMYFLIGIWGGPRKEYASIKFFLYTLFGSLLILLSIIGLYLSVSDPAATAVLMGLASDVSLVSPDMIEKVQALLQSGDIQNDLIVHTFNMANMMDGANYIPGSVFHPLSDWNILGLPAREIGFLALFIGFYIKLPGVPLHTWLPDAHVEAPTPVSVILAGILLKVGGYGIIRTAVSIFPEVTIDFSWYIALAGVISILYAAFNALAMKDLKKMIAYSSVSHMGFVLLGIAAMTEEGLNGALYMMVSHGVLAAMLFLCAGVLDQRTKDRNIASYRGLSSKMPRYTTMVTIAFFASLGLPGFSGFISEILVLIGAYRSSVDVGFISGWMPVAAAAGIVVGAAYFLWTLQKMFFGKFWVNDKLPAENLSDLKKEEMFLLVPLAILTVILGLFPSILLKITGPTVAVLINSFLK